MVKPKEVVPLLFLIDVTRVFELIFDFFGPKHSYLNVSIESTIDIIFLSFFISTQHVFTYNEIAWGRVTDYLLVVLSHGTTKKGGRGWVFSMTPPQKHTTKIVAQWEGGEYTKLAQLRRSRVIFCV